MKAHPEESSPAVRIALEKARSTVTVKDGRIFWDGVYRSRDMAEKLRASFARPPAGDWFATQSKAYAQALTEALRQTEEEHA